MASTKKVNDRLARGQLHRLVRSLVGTGRRLRFWPYFGDIELAEDALYVLVNLEARESAFRPSDYHVPVLYWIGVSHDMQGEKPVGRVVVIHCERVLGKSEISAHFAEQAALQEKGPRRSFFGNLKRIIDRRRVHRPNETEISCGEPEETIHEAKSVDGNPAERRSQACSPSASSIG